MFFRIVFAQARSKWGVTALIFLTLTSLVGLYVYLENVSTFSNRAMQLIMKQMGHNLLILPEDADELAVYTCADNQQTFSEKSTETLARYRRLASKYYVSVLQERITLKGRTCLLTGIRPVERGDETAEKGNLIKKIPEGDVRLGARASDILGAQKGDTVVIRDQNFHVENVLPLSGTLEDFRVYMPLDACQALLNKEALINAIWAFECLHDGTLDEVAAFQERELAKALPGFRQIRQANIARGRYLARELTYRSLYYLLLLVLAVTILVIAVSGIHEVAERKGEVGVFTSMGTGFSYIVALYSVKMLVIALCASAVGFFVGSWFAVSFNSTFLTTNTHPVQIIWADYPAVAMITVLVALAGQVWPMIKLVRMDPSATLTDDKL